MNLVMEPQAVATQADQLEIVYQQAFPTVLAFVLRHGGTLADAQDVFHEALLAFCELPQTHEYIRSPQAYVIGIAKNCWLKQCNRTMRHAQVVQAMHVDTADAALNVSLHKLFLFVRESGKKCLELLHAFYYDNLRPAEIARQHGYPHEHAVSVQKHKCILKLRKTIQSKGITYDTFTEDH